MRELSATTVGELCCNSSILSATTVGELCCNSSILSTRRSIQPPVKQVVSESPAGLFELCANWCIQFSWPPDNYIGDIIGRNCSGSKKVGKLHWDYTFERDS